MLPLSVCLVTAEGCGHAGGHETTQVQPVPALEERQRLRECTTGHKKTDMHTSKLKVPE